MKNGYQVTPFFKIAGSFDFFLWKGRNERQTVLGRDPYTWRQYGIPIGYKIRTRNPYHYAFVGKNADDFRKRARRHRHLRIIAEILGVVALIVTVILVINAICNIPVPHKP